MFISYYCVLYAKILFKNQYIILNNVLNYQKNQNETILSLYFTKKLCYNAL